MWISFEREREKEKRRETVTHKNILHIQLEYDLGKKSHYVTGCINKMH